MLLKDLCVLVLWTKIASAPERLNAYCLYISLNMAEYVMMMGTSNRVAKVITRKDFFLYGKFLNVYCKFLNFNCLCISLNMAENVMIMEILNIVAKVIILKD